jgi:hypothetical protein
MVTWLFIQYHNKGNRIELYYHDDDDHHFRHHHYRRRRRRLCKELTTQMHILQSC